MATRELPGSGTIKLSEVKTEFEKGNNLLDYLGEGGVTSSAPLKLTDFYGTSASAPASSTYPGNPVGLKKHGHSYGYRDIPESAVLWGCNHQHQITANATSEYNCVTLTNPLFEMEEDNTVYLVDYKIRLRGINSSCSMPKVYITKSNDKADLCETGWPPAWGSSIGSYGGSKVEVAMFESSSSSIFPFEADDDDIPEIPEDQRLLPPEQRGYSMNRRVVRHVRRTESGMFGLNKKEEIARWSVYIPQNSPGDSGTWRTAEGQMYFTLTGAPDTYRIGIFTRLAKSMENGYRTGMDVILDKLIATPITEEEHEANAARLAREQS